MLKLEQMYGCESHKGRLGNYNQPNRPRNQSAVEIFLWLNSRFFLTIMGQDGESDFSAHVLQGLCESSRSVGHVFVAQKCKMK